MCLGVCGLPSGSVVAVGLMNAIAQGRLVAVVGVPGNGKSTFLRLLGHQAFPTEGSIFIPILGCFFQ